MSEEGFQLALLQKFSSRVHKSSFMIWALVTSGLGLGLLSSLGFRFWIPTGMIIRIPFPTTPTGAQKPQLHGISREGPYIWGRGPDQRMAVPWMDD